MKEKYFQHVDGGLYRFVAYARLAENEKEVVVYEHLWPFDVAFWVRDRVEFEARFKPTSEEWIDTAMQRDRKAAQTAVRAAKTARRAANGRT